MIAAVSIPASSINHAPSPSASALAFVTPHVSISTSRPREISRIYAMSNGDPSSRSLPAPSAAKATSSQSYPSSSKVRVKDMAPAKRSAAVEGYKAKRSGSVAGPSTHRRCPPRPPRILAVRPRYIFPTAIWRDWSHGELFFPAWPRTFRLSYTTARPILFWTCKSIRTGYQWNDDLHHLALTFPIISNNNEITTYRKESVRLRAGSSSRLDDDTYTTSNAHNAAGYAFSCTKCIPGARTFASP